MKSDQEYISDKLFHFIGRSKPEAEQLELLKTILRTGTLRASERQYSENDFNTLCSDELRPIAAVCFADIPLFDLGLHMAKYDNFRVGFSKNFLIERGANPVFYIAINSQTHIHNEPRGVYLPDRLNEIFKAMARLAVLRRVNGITVLIAPTRSKEGGKNAPNAPFLWTRPSYRGTIALAVGSNSNGSGERAHIALWSYQRPYDFKLMNYVE